MKLFNWYKERYFVFEGRIGRLHYLIHTLILIGHLLAAGFLYLLVNTVVNRLELTSLSALTVVAGIVMLAAMALTAIGNISLAVRRLHDLNFSGIRVVPYIILTGIAEAGG
jgi:uncharacterized membrane protein YhaH (DUF805 family)